MTKQAALTGRPVFLILRKCFLTITIFDNILAVEIAIFDI